MVFIALLYFIMIFFRMNKDIKLRYIHFEFAIFALALVIIREVVMYKRVKKMGAKKIIDYSINKYLFRMILVIAFYLFLFSSAVIVALIGPVCTIVLPRPISERFYVTGSGYILVGIYYDYDSIDKIKFSDSGILEIINNGEKTRVLRHTKNQKNAIYQHLRKFQELE